MPELRGRAARGASAQLGGVYGMRRVLYHPPVAVLALQQRAREFGIRRDLSPGAAGRTGARNLRVLTAEENKENIPPEVVGGGSSSQRRGRKKKKSPLPVWYPRTPLRDITAIVNAMERRRIRLRAASRQRTVNMESSPADPSPTTPVHETLSVFEHASPSQYLPSNFSENSASLTSSITTASTSIGSQSQSSVTSTSVATDAALAAESAKKLKFIEELERAVLENLKNMSKLTEDPPKRSALMSMR